MPQDSPVISGMDALESDVRGSFDTVDILSFNCISEDN